MQVSFLACDLNGAGVQSNANYNTWMLIFETLVFLALAFFQVYYIKRILENKRIV